VTFLIDTINPELLECGVAGDLLGCKSRNNGKDSKSHLGSSIEKRLKMQISETFSTRQAMDTHYKDDWRWLNPHHKDFID
jgi:hypothetical protein